jgi:hypothetical protein
MDKSTKNNGPIFQISRNKSYPSETTQKIFKVVSNENINKKNISNSNEDKKNKHYVN